MLTILVWGILALVVAVYCEKEPVEFSNITSRSTFYTQRYVEPPSLEESPEIGSREHRVTPGKKEKTCNCGRANQVGARIIGGRQFRPFEYPFLVTVSYTPNQAHSHCGGTIISDRHVLTAAHCTSKARKLGGLFVIVAVHTIGNSPRSYTVPVQRLIQHGHYIPEPIINDIALLYLKNPLQWTQVVSPVCMPFPGMSVTGKNVRVIGWGATRSYGPMSVNPQKVDLQVISKEKCHQYWRYNVTTNPFTQICTMSKNRYACYGDSGSPAVWLDPESNRYIIVGIVSFGDNCIHHKPDVYASVVFYLPWIMNAIQATTPGRRLCAKKKSGK